MSLGVQIDGNGLSVKSFREIREALADKMHGIFGENLDLSPSSPDGQLIDLFCYAYSDAAEAFQAGFTELDVGSAEGVFLDNIGTIMGIHRNGDDDDAFRNRLLSSNTTGLATFDNMLSYLRNNIDVGVSLVENSEPTVDQNGIPGHSVAVYIPEGYSAEDSNGNDVTEDYVAQQIWNCKPAGIKTHGTSSGNAKDVTGAEHTIYYTHVTKTSPYFMRITITRYKEEDLPTDYVSEVRAAVAKWALTEYTPGKDIIPKRAIQAVYTVSGIDDVVIEVSDNGSSDWTEDRIPIDLSHYAYLPEINISVELITGA